MMLFKPFEKVQYCNRYSATLHAAQSSEIAIERNAAVATPCQCHALPH